MSHIVGNLLTKIKFCCFILVTHLLNIFSSKFIFPVVAEAARCASKFLPPPFFHYNKKHMAGQLYYMSFFFLLLHMVMRVKAS